MRKRPRSVLEQRIEEARARVIRHELERALHHHEGNKRAAAEALGISYRQLFLLVKKYGVRA